LVVWGSIVQECSDVKEDANAPQILVDSGSGARFRLVALALMAKGKAVPFLSWIVAAGGSVLLYAAYKNKSPLSLLQETLGVGTATPIQTTFAGRTASGTVSTGASPAGSSDAEYEAKFGPLVEFGHGKQLLRQKAADSFRRVEAAYGKTIPTTGAYRTPAAQAAGYAKSPGRFLPPSKGVSKHVRGIAVDLNTITVSLNDPRLVAAFQAEGWHRPGASHAGVPEPWHWSYVERG